MAVSFSSVAEFREVMDRLFGHMNANPEMGPALRDADVPQRIEFEDLDLVINLRAGRPGAPSNLHWKWTDDIDWEPRVRMNMSSEVANRYFQGRENVAIARRPIKTGGDIRAAPELIPVTKPVYAHYRAMVTAEYPHLGL